MVILSKLAQVTILWWFALHEKHVAHRARFSCGAHQGRGVRGVVSAIAGVGVVHRQKLAVARGFSNQSAHVIFVLAGERVIGRIGELPGDLHVQVPRVIPDRSRVVPDQHYTNSGQLATRFGCIEMGSSVVA
jgi:hypothetical protein